MGGGSIFWKTSDTALYSTYVSTLCRIPLDPTKSSWGGRGEVRGLGYLSGGGAFGHCINLKIF